MSTIIFGIIGILLAAVAALMVVYYGQDSFTEVSTKAEAGRLMSEGVQIQAASAAYYAQEGTHPGKDDGDFLGDLIDRRYLTHKPIGATRPLGTNLSTAWKFDKQLGIARAVIGSSDNTTAVEICSEARKSVGLLGSPKQCTDSSITPSDPCCVMPEASAG